MTLAPLELSWSPRAVPLEPVAVLASADAVDGLRRATLARLTAGIQLRASAGEDWLLVLGRGTELPWADGVIYLGWDAGLLVCTTLRAWPPLALVRTALPVAPLMVLLPGQLLLSPLPLRPADPRLLSDLAG